MELIKKYAVNYLSKYDSTTKNLKIILKKKISRLKVEKKDKFILYNSIDNLLLDFEKKGLIDDINYTDRKILNFSNQGKSKNFIIYYLLKKGIKKKDIDDRFKKFEINNEDWEYHSAKLFARKKKLDKNNKEKKEKYLAKMSRAGFSYSLCKKVLDL